MKEKIIFALVIIATFIYLMFSICQCHNKWLSGITAEEQIR